MHIAHRLAVSADDPFRLDLWQHIDALDLLCYICSKRNFVFRQRRFADNRIAAKEDAVHQYADLRAGVSWQLLDLCRNAVELQWLALAVALNLGIDPDAKGV